jgi:hypothetical protein
MKETSRYESFCRWLANRLPKMLIYYAGMRLLSYATTGRYSNIEVPRVTVMEALGCWERQDNMKGNINGTIKM